MGNRLQKGEEKGENRGSPECFEETSLLVALHGFLAGLLLPAGTLARARASRCAYIRVKFHDDEDISWKDRLQ